MSTLLLLLSLLTAQAGEEEFEAMYKRRTGMAWGGVGATGGGAALVVGGLVVTLVGVGTATAGGLTGDESSTQEGTAKAGKGLAFMVLGGAGLLSGPALMAGGSLGAARALDNLNQPTRKWAGRTAWGLWGGTFVVGASRLGSGGSSATKGLGTAMYAGSIAAGGIQMSMNQRAWEKHRGSEPESPASGDGAAPAEGGGSAPAGGGGSQLELRLRPWSDVQGRQGLVLEGRF